MNENTEQSTQPSADKRLAVLKAKIGFEFAGLLEKLEAGAQIVLITGREIGKELKPNSLRRIGSAAALCNAYGATLVVVHPDKLVWFKER